MVYQRDEHHKPGWRREFTILLLSPMHMGDRVPFHRPEYSFRTPPFLDSLLDQTLDSTEVVIFSGSDLEVGGISVFFVTAAA